MLEEAKIVLSFDVGLRAYTRTRTKERERDSERERFREKRREREKKKNVSSFALACVKRRSGKFRLEEKYGKTKMKFSLYLHLCFSSRTQISRDFQLSRRWIERYGRERGTLLMKKILLFTVVFFAFQVVVCIRVSGIQLRFILKWCSFLFVVIK